MTNAQDFPLTVVHNACAGAGALRERLLANGLDTTTIAALVGSSPLTIARATRSGSTPRGVLIGLATLVAVVDRLAELGVAPADVAKGTAGEAADAVAAESAIAARVIERMRRMPAPAGPVQLSLAVRGRMAA